MILVRTLSLFAYFTYIFIDIIIYTLERMLRSSGIFWMVGRVVADSYLDLTSLYGVVPWVPILIILAPSYNYRKKEKITFSRDITFPYSFRLFLLN
jgi:hypothetical protein